MVFDELLDGDDENYSLSFLEPTRKAINPLLGVTWKQYAVTILIYSFQLIFAYIYLNKFLSFQHELNFLELTQLYAFFIAIAAFVDQIINPDENTKLGYYALLIIYYVIYKFTIFGGSIFLILRIFDIHYELHYLEESLIIMTVFVAWAVGQKIGFKFEHGRLLKKADEMGFDALNDIDKLKIFLYQVHRRSFLKMMIQTGKAKFHDTSHLELTSHAEVQMFSRLVTLNMSKFMKYLKLTHLPENKYVTFSQIKEIDFSKNKIKKFNTWVLKIFPNVEKIDLSHNKIKKIEDADQEEILLLNRSIEINFDGNPVFA